MASCDLQDADADGSGDSAEETTITEGLSRCLLLHAPQNASTHDYLKMQPLCEVLENDRSKRLLVERFGKGGMPLVCSGCGFLMRRAMNAAREAHRTKAGKHFIATARAFNARPGECFIDEPPAEPVVQHIGVLMHQTCNSMAERTQ